jgi:hypothetical protein
MLTAGYTFNEPSHFFASKAKDSSLYFQEIRALTQGSNVSAKAKLGNRYTYITLKGFVLCKPCTQREGGWLQARLMQDKNHHRREALILKRVC